VNGTTTDGYQAGGARGEVARGTAEETETTKGATSSHWATGTRAILGDCMVITEPVAEQIGQTCDTDGVDVRSAQKWNCAVRKKTLRSTMRTDFCRAVGCI
jgi:hypothetical protein